jgi:hypothetical protein
VDVALPIAGVDQNQRTFGRDRPSGHAQQRYDERSAGKLHGEPPRDLVRPVRPDGLSVADAQSSPSCMRRQANVIIAIIAAVLRWMRGHLASSVAPINASRRPAA